MSALDIWVGAPYREFDCYDLLRHAADDLFDIEYPELGFDYYADPTGAIELELRSNWRWNKLMEPEIGCIVLLSTGGIARHVGLWLGNGEILHTTRKMGSVIQDIQTIERYYDVEGYFTWAA